MSKISNALATINTADRELTTALDYARKLSASDLLPDHYKGKPQNVLWAVEYGRALGVDPIVAINQIHSIKGKQSVSAQLMGALVRKAGHKLRVTWDGATARATVIRADDDGFEFEAVWTMDRAKAAGLTSNQTYQKFPASMLKARAISEVVRDACPEVLAGASYVPEELGADVAPVLPPDDEPASVPVVEQVDEATGEVLDGEVVDEPTLPEVEA